MARLRILITGANGFLGNCISKYLKSRNHSISVLKRSEVENIFLSKDFINNNFDNFSCFPTLNREYDCLIHMAAMPYAESENYINKAEIVNIKLTDYLARYCQINDIYLLFFSTVQVYGSILNGKYTESSLPNPKTIYAKTKREAELKMINRINEFELRGKILRLGNIVGKPLTPNSNGWKLFANKIILDSIIQGKIHIKNNPYLRRSFLSIDLLLNFINIFIDNNFSRSYDQKQIINLTSGQSISLINFALKVIKFNQKLINNKVELITNNNLMKPVPNFNFSNKELKNIMPNIDEFTVDLKIKQMILSIK